MPPRSWPPLGAGGACRKILLDSILFPLVTFAAESLEIFQFVSSTFGNRVNVVNFKLNLMVVCKLNLMVV